MTQTVSSAAGSRSPTVSWTATGSGKHIKRTITYILKDKKSSINERKILIIIPLTTLIYCFCDSTFLCFPMLFYYLSDIIYSAIASIPFLFLFTAI